MRTYIPPHRREAANVTDGSPTSRRSRPKPNQLDSAAAPAYPPWVLLERNCIAVPRGSRIADPKTLAAGTTSTGHTIAVALCVAAPPEGSRVCVELPDGVPNYSTTVLVAHGDSVLVWVPGIKGREADHFIYNAGAAGAATPRPPALLLLPPPPRSYYQGTNCTGILRRGEDEFVVPALRVARVVGTTSTEAELHLLRSGEWSVKRPPISHYYGGSVGEGAGHRESSWNIDAVIPVGDELLCWADMSRGLLFSKVFDDCPGLRYVPLPADNYFPRASYRNVCATAGGGTVKLVNMFPRCCCGDAVHTFCRRSRRAYTVHTWTLRMDNMTWVKDGMLDATQLWALDGYKGVPRVRLDCPVVSLEEPDAICFVVCEANHESDADDKTTWVIMVDMRSKTLRSVFRYPRVRTICSKYLCPSMVSGYFNSKASSSKPDDEQAVPSSLASKSNEEIELQTDDVKKPLMQRPVESSGAPMEGSTAASPEAMILATLEEIPGLNCDDMLKAYRILSHDGSGRRFRSLMGLPMNLRKDCVLLEIRASEACFICSSCLADLQL